MHGTDTEASLELPDETWNALFQAVWEAWMIGLGTNRSAGKRHGTDIPAYITKQ